MYSNIIKLEYIKMVKRFLKSMVHNMYSNGYYLNCKQTSIFSNPSSFSMIHPCVCCGYLCHCRWMSPWRWQRKAETFRRFTTRCWSLYLILV